MATQDINSPRSSLETVLESGLYPGFQSHRNRLFSLNQALKLLIKELGKSGITYKDLQRLSGVDENALKQFMFRKSERPRCTDITRKLADAIEQLDQLGRLEKSPTLAMFYYSVHSIAFGSPEPVQYQLEEFHRYISNRLQNGALATATSMINSAPISRTEMTFFCYKKSSKHPAIVEKSKYNFFRPAEFPSSECFFKLRSPEQETVKYGIVKMANNEVTLFSFNSGDLFTTHLRCFPDKRRASGVTVSARPSGIYIEFSVLVPEDQVSSKEIGLLNMPSTSFFKRGEVVTELSRFQEDYQEFFRSI